MPAPLRILFAALGYIPIPPVGYGGIESIIWEYTQRLRAKGHTVDIVNASKHRVFWEILKHGKYDFLHCHHERGLSRMMAANLFKGSRVICTSHRGYFLDAIDHDAEKCLRLTARAPHIMVIREDVAAELRRRNPSAKVVVQPNGTEASQFRVASKGNGRAICLAMVEKRKRQDFIFEQIQGTGIDVDFAGPLKESILPEGANFLGEWTRETIREKLTDYTTLILVSDREGGGPPLVVAEALAAGLNVVVSPMAYGNLDLAQPFIHPVDRDEDFLPALRASMEQEHRAEARRYCEENFSWEVLTDRYEQQLLAWRS